MGNSGRQLVCAAVGLVLALLGAACTSSSETPPATSTADPASPRPRASITATASPVAEPSPTATPTPEPRRPEANPFPEDLEAIAAELLERILEERGGSEQANVDMFVLTRDQARAFYSGPEGNDSNGPEPLDPKRRVYGLLGLIPIEEDLRESEIDNLISLITGFYSPPLRALYVLETINGGIYGSLARSTIVHELTHAIQYQNYDIAGLAAERSENWDATTALLDVIEGEAVFTEIRILGFSTRSTYRQPVCFTIPAPQRAGTPFVVERDLDTWYEDGLCFVEAMRLDAGVTARQIFADLPISTEQILHPEKYLAGEEPLEVTLPDLEPLLGGQWRLVHSNRLGEFGLQNLLQPGLPSNLSRVQSAAAGWGGDKLQLYTDGEGFLLQAEVVWDGALEAAEFWAALRDSIGNRSPASFQLENDNCLMAAMETGTSWQLQHQSGRITLMVTDEASVLAALGVLFPHCGRD